MKGNNKEHRATIQGIAPIKTSSLCEQHLLPSYTETESLGDLLNRGRMVQKSIAINVFNRDNEKSAPTTRGILSNQHQHHIQKANKDEQDSVAILPPATFLPVVPPSNISRSYLSLLTSQYLSDFSITTESGTRMLNESTKTVSFLPTPSSTEDSAESNQGAPASYYSCSLRNTATKEDVSMLKRHQQQQHPPNKKRRFQRRNSKCPSMFHVSEQHNFWNDEDDKDCQSKLSPQQLRRSSPERLKSSSKKKPISPWGAAA